MTTIPGFCSRCFNILAEKGATEHATKDECIEVLLRRVNLYRDRADSEHAWVHRLEDELAHVPEEPA